MSIQRMIADIPMYSKTMVSRKNENRIIVWPAIATTWILNGTDSQREFIEQNWELIFN